MSKILDYGIDIEYRNIHQELFGGFEPGWGRIGLARKRGGQRPCGQDGGLCGRSIVRSREKGRGVGRCGGG